MDGRLKNQEESMRAQSSDSFETMENREELVKKVKYTASVFYEKDSETFKLVESLARKTPLLSVWAERASGSELVQSIKRVRPSLTEEKANEVAACFLPYPADEKKEIYLHTRLATRASRRRRSNEYMQYNSAHSEQDKGACAKASPIDPTLPKYTQVHMWKKDVWDEVMSIDTGREGTMQALISRAESSGCAFEFRFTGEKPSVGIYKPDVIMIAKGRPLSMLKAFGVLLNVDSTTEGNYDSDAKVGHVITYAQEFLKLVGPVRKSVVVGVTNFVMVRFFRVMRADDEPLLAPNNLNGFIIKRDEPTSNAIQVLSAYLQAKPASLDVNINMNSWECLLPGGWMLQHHLGRGRTSTVYLAIGGDDRKYAVKVSCPGYNVDNDLNCLDKLGGIDGIPRVHLSISSSVLVLQPVGKPLTRENFCNYKNVLALGDLVDVLEAAHERKILHRDIRVDNIMIAVSFNTGQQRLFLLDWGYAARCDAIGDFSGSMITASDHVLSQLVTRNTNRIVYTCADDLISLVRCLFLFTYQRTSSSLYENTDDPGWILQFWKQALEGKVFWAKAQAFALQMDYAMLKEWLLVLQDTIGD